MLGGFLGVIQGLKQLINVATFVLAIVAALKMASICVKKRRCIFRPVRRVLCPVRHLTRLMVDFVERADNKGDTDPESAGRRTKPEGSCAAAKTSRVLVKQDHCCHRAGAKRTKKMSLIRVEGTHC